MITEDKILIVAATELEVSKFLANCKEEIKQNNNLFVAKTFDLLITFPSIPFTIYNLMKHLNNHKYKLAVNIGIAGSFEEYFKIGEIIEVTKDIFADIGKQENSQFKSIFEMNIIDKNEVNWFINKSKTNLPQATAITVNTILTNKNDIEKQKAKYQHQVETMEGAAFTYVCQKEKIDYYQIRAISNYIGENDKTKWDIQQAIEVINKQLANITC